MTDLSKIKDKQVVKTKDSIITYEVVEKKIDLKAKREELEELKNITQPDDQEVLDLAKIGFVHPYYEKDKEERIKQLESEVK